MKNIKKIKNYQQNFIDKANKIHNYKYDYSNVEYINYGTKVKIICKLHGEFSQTPKNHNGGQGCSGCFGTTKRTIEEFIEKANNIHSSKFNYSKVMYENTNKKVIIGCNVHGDFLQTPYNHLSGQGCRKCYGKHLNTLEEFIEKANKIHNSKFTYLNSKYVNSQTKLNITCKTHGDFSQKPNDHLMGYGCHIVVWKLVTVRELD